jgi:hypothetical protein
VISNRILAHCGLSRPYRFERLLAILVAAILGIVAALTAVGFAITGELSRHTPRELYFLYLARLIVLGAGLAPWPRLSTAVLALVIVDFSLGVGSHALREFDLADSSILPANYNLGGGFT